MLVSVAVITYNHERFIASALDSILMQRLDAELEIVVSDDCSQDGTARVVEEYARRHPGIIRPNLRRTNVGIGRNFRETIESCRGDFIALLEGDDYWTNPRKLARQIELLERKPHWSGCCHRADLVLPDGRPLGMTIPAITSPTEFDQATLMRKGSLSVTPTLVFRRRALAPFLDGFDELRIGDFPLCVGLTVSGPIGYVPDRMASCRQHPGGTYSASTSSYRAREVVKMYEYVNRATERRYERWIRGYQAYWRFMADLDGKDYKAARANARRRVISGPVDGDTLRACLGTVLPQAYTALRRLFHITRA